jgi:hypothetical protein
VLDCSEGDGIPPTKPPRKSANDAYVILDSGRRGFHFSALLPGLEFLRIWGMVLPFSVDAYWLCRPTPEVLASAVGRSFG